MTIRSMTGFGREAGHTGTQQWAWELRSVNGRGLDVRVRVPGGLEEVGEAARGAVAAALSRGQCQLTLTLARAAGPGRVRLNRDALDALVTALSDVVLPPSVRPATLDGLLAVRGIVEIDDDGGPAVFDEALRRDLSGAIGRLVAAVVAARTREGEALAVVLDGQVARIDGLVYEAERCPARRPDAVRARLAEQVAALVGTGQALDSARLHAEAVLIATRADIREELDRLRAHVAGARELLAQSGPIGRRLDFLAQEFGREANTLCAKAGDVSLSRIGLDLKTVVEQFREQVQNVE